MTTIRQVFSVLALCLVACGSPTDGGTGGGNAASGGGVFGGGSGSVGGGSGTGGGSQNPVNCQTRCETHFGGCGVPNPAAGCSSLCTNLTATQLTCIEQQSCAENPDACTQSNTGGGSGSTGGGSGSTGGGSGSTGGGGGNTCAVPSSALKVSLPHTTAAGVLFTAGSNCSVNGNWAGYNWVWNSMLFVDLTTSAQSTIHSTGSLYEIEYTFEQRALTSGEKSAAANETGIPLAAISAGEFMSRTSEAPVVIDGLPNDVTLVAQVTSNAPPSIKFVSSSSSALSTLQTRLNGNGVLVNIPLSTMNASVNRVAEFQLKNGELKLLMLRL